MHREFRQTPFETVDVLEAEKHVSQEGVSILCNEELTRANYSALLRNRLPNYALISPLFRNPEPNDVTFS